VSAGEDWRGTIDERIERADLVLLLVSSAFLASDYCWDVELKRAMERHARGEVRVVPIILRPCDWDRAPFAKLRPLPSGGVPVTGAGSWTSVDAALLDVTQGIEAAAGAIAERKG
jgi:hypothetical protein